MTLHIYTVVKRFKLSVFETSVRDKAREDEATSSSVAVRSDSGCPGVVAT